MPKFSLTKSIEARKLNKRTKVPTADPEVTIPYGGIVDNIEYDRDLIKFTYLGEPFCCAEDRMKPALGDAMGESAAAPPAPSKTADPAAPARPKLPWEPVESTHYTMMRARVPGGWLVMINNTGLFYPDPSHEWTIE